MKKIICSLLLLSLSAVAVFAQDQKSKFQPHFGIGVGISVPQGVRFDISQRWNDYLSTRLGIGFIPSIKIHEGNVEEIEFSEYKDALGYTPEVSLDANAGSFTGHLLLDYHPFKNGFRLTAGALVGNAKAKGHLALINPQTGTSIMDDPRQTVIDPNDMPKVTVTGKKSGEVLVLQPAPDATIDATLSLGRAVQPYVGIGYGYAVPVKRVSFTLDAGVLFSGKALITSPNVVKGDPNMLFSIAGQQGTEIRYYTQMLPVLNLGISIRLF